MCSVVFVLSGRSSAALWKSCSGYCPSEKIDALGALSGCTVHRINHCVTCLFNRREGLGTYFGTCACLEESIEDVENFSQMML